MGQVHFDCTSLKVRSFLDVAAQHLRRGFLRLIRIAPAVATVALLHACGGGSSGGSAPAPVGPGSVISAGSSCDMQYTLTGSALIEPGRDPLLGQQWHLDNTGTNTGQDGALAGEDLRAFDAWAFIRRRGREPGEGVQVAVLDDSVELTHADLWPNVAAGASHSYRVGNPYPDWPVPCHARYGDDRDDTHGTSVAGLIAARDDNQIGIAGVAPRAMLAGFDPLSTNIDADLIDALTRAPQRNFVYNNSWGAPDDGHPNAAPAAIREAIRATLATGRNGLGSVYVFPGGNGGCFNGIGNYPPCDNDNSNLDGYANQYGVIAVCAVDDTGRSPWYAEPGANLLVCAPSSTSEGTREVGITTTAIRGSYRNDFGGTSASTPMVSGVVALMLSVNPALTWRDVRLILADTARRNDPTDPGWLPAATAGGAFHHRYGYGVVDAAAAVALAANWSSVGTSASLRTCEDTLGLIDQAIPDATQDAGATVVAPLSSALTLDPSRCGLGTVESVEITVTINHTNPGELGLRLISPTERASVLVEPRLGGCLDGRGTAVRCDGYRSWTFSSTRHIGEAVTGTWRLEVTDRLPDDVGTLTQWSLRIHGR